MPEYDQAFKDKLAEQLLLADPELVMVVTDYYVLRQQVRACR